MKRYHPSAFPPSASVLLPWRPLTAGLKAPYPLSVKPQFSLRFKEKVFFKKKKKSKNFQLYKGPGVEWQPFWMYDFCRPSVKAGPQNCFVGLSNSVNKAKYFFVIYLFFVKWPTDSCHWKESHLPDFCGDSQRFLFGFSAALPAELGSFHTAYPSVPHRRNEAFCWGTKNARHASEMHKWLH